MSRAIVDYPSFEEDMRALLGENYTPDPVERIPTGTEIQKFSEHLKSPTRGDLTALHVELNSRYDSDRVGSLMQRAILDRDRQLQLIARAGVDTILDMLAEGYFLPRIAQMLEVSHALLAVFVKENVPQELFVQYESLAVDRQVDNAVLNLQAASGRDDISQAKALADITLKVAKARSDKWVERKQMGDTYVQQNFTGGASGASGEGNNRPVAGFQLVLRDPSELKPMKPVPTVTKNLSNKDTPDPLVVNGEFRPVPHDDADHTTPAPVAMQFIDDLESEEDEPYGDI